MSEAQAPDQYAHWRENLALDYGKRLPIFEDQPESGFYRRKDNGRYVPVAIWRDDDGLHVLENGEEVGNNRQLEVWMWCAKSPIEKVTYDAMINNSGIDDVVYAELLSDPNHLLERAKAIAAIPSRIENEADAMRLADALHVARSIEKISNDLRDNLEAPHKESIRGVYEILKPPADIAKAAQVKIKQALGDHIEATGKPVKGQLGKAVSRRLRKVRHVMDAEKALAWIVENEPEKLTSAVASIVRASKEDIAGTELMEVESVQ